MFASLSGKIISIVRGERRFVDTILIEVDGADDAVEFKKYDSAQLQKLCAEDVIAQLTETGYLAYLIQRPFSRMVDVSVKPKSIFVNAMNTGPFQVDASVVVDDAPEAFQAGIDILTKLTDGAVNVCIAPNASDVLKNIKNAEVHTFAGPHPAGNTSVHIAA